MSLLLPEERRRYARQMQVPQIGESGQEKLKKAKVFIAGIGGLGSVSAYYLTAAGVGQIRIADSDCVDFSNLNRQLLHFTDDIGIPKPESALRKLQAVNPFCRITALHDTIRSDNVLDLVGDSDMILDAADNIRTRRVLNRASLQLKIPFIYGGANGFCGSVSTFIPGKTACFDCLFSSYTDSPDPIGVIGPAPAVTASIQCFEAIKIILGMKGLLTNRLLTFNGETMTLKTLHFDVNPDCPVCGSNPGERL